MRRRQWAATDWLAVGLAALYGADRLARQVAVSRFFGRPLPPPPAAWPSVTLLHPVTRARHDLRRALASRFQLAYPAPLDHLLICDVADHASQALCREVMAAHPAQPARLVLVEPASGTVASKIVKLQAALPHVTGQVLGFIDDDIVLRPDALRLLVPPLLAPDAGATFGLACYTTWRNPWSSLMSAFVNANALLSYIPLTFLTEPFTITGHCFAVRRADFLAAGGFDGLTDRLDDDHELARRLRRLGRRLTQTPLVYEVENVIESPAAYQTQLKRWFVIPRQAMLPFLTPAQRRVTLLGGVSQLLPGLLGGLALLSRRPAAVLALAGSLALFLALYALGEWRYLGRTMPGRWWPLLPVVATVTPVHVLLLLLSDDRVEWRGQRLRVHRGGRFEVL